MTRTDLPGPGLTEEQWARLKALATSLSPEQSTWVGGYFTGFADAARSAAGTLVPGLPVAAAPPGQRTLTVLYGSETGNGDRLADEIVAHAATLGLAAQAIDAADYKPAALKQEQDLLVIASTHGEGEPPQPALAFFEYLDSRKAPRLQGVRFAVMALGDSTYEFYCEAGKRLDRRLEELGGERMAPRIDCDVDQLGQGKGWAIRIVEALAETVGKASAPAVAAAPVPVARRIDQANPFLAEVLENIVITGAGSSKETRHIELSLEGSGLVYEPGDALGIVGRNDERVVAEVLDCLALDGAAPVEVEGQQTTLAQALGARFEIATATPRFLSHWAELSGAMALSALAEPGKAAERLGFLEAHHIVDILRDYPVKGVAADRFIAGLRGLQPRLYSIASSQAAREDEVHVTVSTVHYSLHERERWGVVSGALSRLEGGTLPVYVKPAPHFRLPTDNVPIVMIGAGTGVAPYRSFMEEREQRGAGGRSWLFFGDRNFRSDFLYQVEWQAHLRKHTLTWMDVAFSRDGGGRTYVQHRLRERGPEVYGWLQDGAHVYVCGDAKGMAPDVHQALIHIVAEAGALPVDAAEDYVRGLQRDGRYQRDVY